MTHKFTTSHIEDSIALFRFYKKMAEGAMDQVSNEQLSRIRARLSGVPFQQDEIDSAWLEAMP